MRDLKTVDAILLAGSRPGADPLATAAGVATKALVPVGGVAMIGRVARTLTDHPRIGRVIVLAQQGAALLANSADTAWLATHPDVQFVESGSGISASLLSVIDAGRGTLPLLVTTADHVLLDAAMIDHFLATVDPAKDDVAVAMVERTVLLRQWPESRRTWLKFRGGWWSGANLFWLGTPHARRALLFWQAIEQDRKKGWKIIAAFGPILLLGSALRLLRLEQALGWAGQRLKLRARLVAMPMAEACIDADKPEDITLIEQILRARDDV